MLCDIGHACWPRHQLFLPEAEAEAAAAAALGPARRVGDLKAEYGLLEKVRVV